MAEFNKSNSFKRQVERFQLRLLRAGINVQRIDIIDPFFSTSISKPFDRLPQFQIESGTDLWGGLKLAIKTEYSSFDRKLEEAAPTELELENGALVNGDRLIVEPEIGWSIERPGWFIAQRKYRHVNTSLKTRQFLVDKIRRLALNYSFDSGLIFEREFSRSEEVGAAVLSRGFSICIANSKIKAAYLI